MSEAESKRGRKRVYDFQRTRESILDAAEALFAEHGFDATSVESIAAQAGYAKSLLFQYFGDKLGLYAQVLRRVDQEVGELLARVLTYELTDETVLRAAQFKEFLTVMVQTYFDYLLEHPRLVRILSWEMTRGWQTFAQVGSQLVPHDTYRLEPLFQKAREAGLLRSDFVPIIQLTLMMPLCQAYLGYLPLYQQLLPQEELASASGLAQARDYLVDFIVAGMMGHIPETPAEKGN
ncbi:TetR/AcrR family transcriptional regulator [Ktedonosporobacter rubrisoli]|uniref:TetR/AcrR family transcriptional regulator n=1 Tax=Ktedonosporobacter rubrisoli TaxID=2509675 RepID=A0A4P6JK21_KTERU|nr:TetR/AcrR family transcriptional regulator [Ktedonosporobacter rubrisoli]QBD75393.1 TetR/AcrR family transcriptional regulator [Ktedonosporobacter rubrisoli]